MTIDYRKLLWKYMNHVGDCEGVTFVDHITPGHLCSDVDFTGEEEQELRLIDKMEKYEHKSSDSPSKEILQLHARDIYNYPPYYRGSSYREVQLINVKKSLIEKVNPQLIETLKNCMMASKGEFVEL